MVVPVVWTEFPLSKNYFPQPSSEGVPQVIDVEYQYQNAGAIDLVGFWSADEVAYGVTVYNSPQGQSLYRARLASLEGYVMPQVPVKIEWGGRSADNADDLRSTVYNAPQGFALSDVIDIFSEAWFVALMEGTKIEKCINEVGGKIQCGAEAILVEVVADAQPGLLGASYFPSPRFPVVASDFREGVQEVYVAEAVRLIQQSMCRPNTQAWLCPERTPLHTSDSVFQRLDDLAYIVGSTMVHEVGHATGLVPDQLWGDDGAHAGPGYLHASPGGFNMMAGSFQGTGGLRVVRDSEGLRQDRRLDNVVQWSFVNRSYLR